MRIFSCSSCNSSYAEPVPPVLPDAADDAFKLHLVERAAIDNYYDSDTWLMSSRHCTAHDYRHCPSGLPDAFLAYLLNTPPVSVHPAVVICGALLVLITLAEAYYLAFTIITERRRVRGVLAKRLLDVAQMRGPDRSIIDPMPSEEDVRNDPASLFHRIPHQQQQQQALMQ